MAGTELVNHGKEIYELLKFIATLSVGGIITGVTTYWITKRTHTHEIEKLKNTNEHEIEKLHSTNSFSFQKELFNHKILMFNDATKSAGKYFKFIDDYCRLLHRMGQSHKGTIYTHSQYEQDLLINLDNKWEYFMDKKRETSTLYGTLNIEILANLINEYYSIFLVLRNNTMANDIEIPNENEMNIFMDKLNVIEINFYKETSIQFNCLK